MAKHSLINPGPERGNKYDEMRHDSMKLRSLGLYGVPKVFLDGHTEMCCEKCCFDSGVHANFCEKSN